MDSQLELTIIFAMFDPLFLSRRAAMSGGMVAPLAAALSPPERKTPAIMLDVREFGAIGDGSADDTAALQRAIDRAGEIEGGATIWLPTGQYRIQSLDFRPRGRDDFSRFITMRGDGSGRSLLVPARTGAVLIDAAGRNNLTLSGLAIDSGRLPSKTAILLGRLAASPNCSGNRFDDVVLRGSFSLATVISFGAETTRWTNCIFSNGHPDPAHCCFLTGNRPSQVDDGVMDALIDGPNTDNAMVGSVFYIPYENAAPVRFSGAAGYAFFGCSLLGGDARGVRLVSYADPQDGVFSGPVAWYGCHFEATGPDACVHWLEVPHGDSYWRNLAMHGGFIVVLSGTPLVDFDRREPTRHPIIQAMCLLAPALPPGCTRVDVHSYALTDCTIDMPGAQRSAVIAFGFVQNCRIDAPILRTPQAVGRVIRVTREPKYPQTMGTGLVLESLEVETGTLENWVVPRGGAGTIAPLNATDTSKPQAGEFVSIAGRSHLVWHRGPGGELTLDPPAKLSSEPPFASPRLNRLIHR